MNEKGGNQQLLKQKNSQLIQTYIYKHSPVSRVEIAQELHLTTPTLTGMVNPLIAKGLLRELAAVTDEAFLREAVAAYGDKIAVGIDIRDGFVAIKGWTEKSAERALDFCAKMQSIGVKTLICTDISRDGAMEGANHDLYRTLSREFNMNIIASGGVSTLEDVQKLAALKIHGAIVGKAYYTGSLDLKTAIEVAK